MDDRMAEQLAKLERLKAENKTRQFWYGRNRGGDTHLSNVAFLIFVLFAVAYFFFT